MGISLSKLMPFALVAALSTGVSANDITAFKDASRLVSIGASLTEIIYELGEENRLVGRDQTASYPPQVQALPDVGYTRSLAPEGVLSISPTALLVIEGAGPPETLDVLSHAGIEYQTVPESYSAEGVIAKVEAVGKALGVEGKAQALADELRTGFAALTEKTSKIESPKRVLFILSNQGGQIMASGTGTAANGIIALAGGINVVSEYQGYKSLTPEAISAAAPDAIVMMARGDLDPKNEELFADAALSQTPAVQNNAIYRLEGEYLLGFGPRTAAAANELSNLLYGTE
jgi:iron complex transport system substrate-binding protein